MRAVPSAPVAEVSRSVVSVARNFMVPGEVQREVNVNAGDAEATPLVKLDAATTLPDVMLPSSAGIDESDKTTLLANEVPEKLLTGALAKFFAVMVTV